MPYNPPSLAEFRVRFAEFETFDDALLSVVMVEASRSVDTTWTEGDYTRGIMYLAAHYASIISRQMLVGGGGGGSVGGSLNYERLIKSISFEGRSVSYENKPTEEFASEGGGGAAIRPDMTLYLLMYEELLKKNVPDILVINGY
jgi:hypothetical protein